MLRPLSFDPPFGMKADGSGEEAGGHLFHMRAITVKRAGSIQSLVDEGRTDKWHHACVNRTGCPHILAGSIRDDGPLPETITDAVKAQEAMRTHTTKATMVVMVATALHSIAVGNMLPTFCMKPDVEFDEIVTICVDQTEFLVSKTEGQGTHQALEW